MKSKENPKDKFYVSNSKYSNLKIKSCWYDYLYDIEELPYYQDFSHDQYLESIKELNLGQMTRYVCFTLVIAQLLVGIVVMPFVNLFYYFTNWTLLITIASIFYSIRAVNNKALL